MKKNSSELVYFVLGINTYLVSGADDSCLYNLASCEIMKINNENTQLLYELANGVQIKNYGEKQMIFLNHLKNQGFGSFEPFPMYIERIRYGQPKDVQSVIDSYIPLQHLYLYITNKCNMNCSFCSQDDIVNRTTGCKRFKNYINDDYLNLSDYQNILDSFKKLNCHTLNIIGGEPLLEKSLLISIIQYAQQIGFKNINLYTNALLLDNEIIEELQNVKLVIRVIGVHSDQELIDLIDNNHSNPMQFKTNIEKLRDNKINFSFNLCITKENQHLKKEMMDYYRTYNPCAISCSYIFDEEFDFSVLYPKKIKPANFLHNLKHNPCIHGKITIYENGNIGTCPLMRNNIIGNIRKDRIYDILGDKKHCLYWDFTMENIVPCKECSSRYYCIDCRAIESTQTGNLYGKKYCPNKKILQAK